MDRKIDNTKSSNWHKCRFNSETALLRFFFVSLMPAFATVLLGHGSGVNAQSDPQALRPDIKIRNIMTTLSTSDSIRLAKDPQNNTLYYLKQNGGIYQVNLNSSNSILAYNSSDHNLTDTQGIAIGPNGTIYLVGNADVGNAQTRATIVKGAIASSGTEKRVWSILAQTAPYPKSNTAYDHRFNGVVVSPNGKFIYVNSGSRTDHSTLR